MTKQENIEELKNKLNNNCEHRDNFGFDEWENGTIGIKDYCWSLKGNYDLCNSCSTILKNRNSNIKKEPITMEKLLERIEALEKNQFKMMQQSGYN